MTPASPPAAAPVEAADAARPAFYALAPGGWRDYVTVLHVPYTAWHLSYVAIGAALAPSFDAARLGAAVAAFFLAVGIAAHALDELHGRPLGTRIPAPVLAGLAGAALAGALGLGIARAVTAQPWLGAFIAVGVFLVLAYNLELLGGRFHDTAWFCLAWGGFPALTGYFAMAGALGPRAALAGAYAVLLSLTQRSLSLRVRYVRRSVARVSGTLELRDGREVPLDRALLIGNAEVALRACAAATSAIAVALVLLRLSAP